MGLTNEILALQISDNLYSYVTEPVSLAEAKLYMKIDDDITEDDDLIETLITSARKQLEKYTGLSFIPKSILAQLKNQCGGIEIPYGPITATIDPSLITDYDDNVIDDFVILGTGGFYYIPDRIDWVQLIYYAGYGDTEDLPEDLKLAIKALTFSLYQQRGEMAEAESTRAYQLAASYCRVWDNLI